MNKIAIVIHGGAGPDSEFIKKHKQEYEKGLSRALEAAYEILKNKGSAVDAVEAAVNKLEDNPIFNAGRGSAINAKGEIEMCASIMDGKNLDSGAVALLKNVKNPISLAKSIMQKTKHIYLGAEGALKYAEKENIELEPHSYFVTRHQYDEYLRKRKVAYTDMKDLVLQEASINYHGTVGAIAVDFQGNLAAATSTGGTSYCNEGRIGESSMIGVGTYADNNTCAVSSTGNSEYLVKGMVAHSISSYIKYKKNKNIIEACKEVIQKDNKNANGDIGIIAIDSKGNIAIEFNCERMHRGWKIGDNGSEVRIY